MRTTHPSIGAPSMKSEEGGYCLCCYCCLLLEEEQQPLAVDRCTFVLDGVHAIS